ncbi:hypothetical protein THOM_1097, partial [Trachipleistophora hominis]
VKLRDLPNFDRWNDKYFTVRQTSYNLDENHLNSTTILNSNSSTIINDKYHDIIKKLTNSSRLQTMHLINMR